MFRPAAVAGSWYPDHPARLAGEVDRYLEQADLAPVVRPRALIAPHAGLMYSGPVAAFAYKLLRNATYGAAVLVGPSHFVPFEGVSIWEAGEWETPFGPVAVDAPLATAVRTACPHVIDLPAAHRREHSLEMQLPFLAHVLPGVPIVPLVMGAQTRDTSFALGDALAQVLANVSNDSNVLLIASSDLSHYENAVTASRMDAIMVRHVEALDAEGLMAALEHEPRHACGGGPMVSVLHAARLLGASSSRVLRYADSGDVSGDKSAVVGYLAAAIA
jgi:AmmeMemoRadiSam system protein B